MHTMKLKIQVSTNKFDEYTLAYLKIYRKRTKSLRNDINELRHWRSSWRMQKHNEIVCEKRWKMKILYIEDWRKLCESWSHENDTIKEDYPCF